MRKPISFICYFCESEPRSHESQDQRDHLAGMITENCKAQEFYIDLRKSFVDNVIDYYCLHTKYLSYHDHIPVLRAYDANHLASLTPGEPFATASQCYPTSGSGRGYAGLVLARLRGDDGQMEMALVLESRDKISSES